MAAPNGHKNSAELEREVEAQRNRVEQTIGEIQDRLSPGQLVDELLSYTKHGGGEFAANLGRTMTANPMPVALLGISLAWLMAGGKSGDSAGTRGNGYHRTESQPMATTSGSGLQRVSHGVDDAGDWYSEFVDDAGRKYRARSDESGKRFGHFADDTGKLFAGFVDEAGQRVQLFRDESGNALDAASGWASHTWHDLRDAVVQGGGDVADSAARLGGDMQARADRITRDAIRTLEEQPLVAAALAFAAGAALGAVLPHTREEDEMLGDTSDKVKREAGSMAGRLYEQGKEQAAELYEGASEKADEVYQQAKSTIAGDEGPGNENPPVRH